MIRRLAGSESLAGAAARVGAGVLRRDAWKAVVLGIEEVISGSLRRSHLYLIGKLN